jgi:hypothetical protein
MLRNLLFSNQEAITSKLFNSKHLDSIDNAWFYLSFTLLRIRNGENYAHMPRNGL